MSDTNGQKVVVTTEHRGVFYGTLARRDDREVTLTGARACLYWSRETRGFLGLASTGPLDGSRVSRAAEELTLTGVTSITKCSAAAVARWEAEPWN